MSRHRVSTCSVGDQRKRECLDVDLSYGRPSSSHESLGMAWCRRFGLSERLRSPSAEKHRKTQRRDQSERIRGAIQEFEGGEFVTETEDEQ